MNAYAVMDSDGNLVSVERGMDEAQRSARRISPEVVVEGEHQQPTGLAGFDDAPTGRMASAAVRASGLPRLDLDDVYRISLDEAHAKLRPFFPTERTRRSGEKARVMAYDSPNEMVLNLLGQNYKTSKETPESPSKVMGLSLLPFNLAQEYAPRLHLPMTGWGFCAGSVDACRRTCLVYSGHNLLDVYNVEVKKSRSLALLRAPRHFARILFESVSRHFNARMREPFEPFVRLNVFSDVPWEAIFPGIFEAFHNNQFYDYTKVAGRDTPPNYDLTFSWSGSNERQVRTEVDNFGRRVAVVFIPPVDTLNRWRKSSNKRAVEGMGLPKTFLGLPVIDGDVTDIRPRDIAPAIVGLRWKTPHGKGVDPFKKTFNSFVVPVQEVDGQLVAPVSARMEPLVDADAGGGE